MPNYSGAKFLSLPNYSDIEKLYLNIPTQNLNIDHFQKICANLAQCQHLQILNIDFKFNGSNTLDAAYWQALDTALAQCPFSEGLYCTFTLVYPTDLNNTKAYWQAFCATLAQCHQTELCFWDLATSRLDAADWQAFGAALAQCSPTTLTFNQYRGGAFDHLEPAQWQALYSALAQCPTILQLKTGLSSSSTRLEQLNQMIEANRKRKLAQVRAAERAAAEADIALQGGQPLSENGNPIGEALPTLPRDMRREIMNFAFPELPPERITRVMDTNQKIIQNRHIEARTQAKLQLDSAVLSELALERKNSQTPKYYVYDNFRIMLVDKPPPEGYYTANFNFGNQSHEQNQQVFYKSGGQAGDELFGNLGFVHRLVKPLAETSTKRFASMYQTSTASLGGPASVTPAVSKTTPPNPTTVATSTTTTTTTTTPSTIIFSSVSSTKRSLKDKLQDDAPILAALALARKNSQTPKFYVYENDAITLADTAPKGYYAANFDLGAQGHEKNQTIYYKPAQPGETVTAADQLFGNHGFVHRLSTPLPNAASTARYAKIYETSPAALKKKTSTEHRNQ